MRFSIVKFKSKNELSREELAVKGDKNSFVELINEYKFSLYRIAKGILYDEERVDEVIQSSIVKAYENIGKLRKPEFFKTWLIRILINECNEVIRKRKKIVYIEDGYKEESYEDTYENIDLTRAINTLDDELKKITVLYYFEDIPQKEIAEILNINESTVRTRLLRARKKLYDLLNENGGK